MTWRSQKWSASGLVLLLCGTTCPQQASSDEPPEAKQAVAPETATRPRLLHGPDGEEDYFLPSALALQQKDGIAIRCLRYSLISNHVQGAEGAVESKVNQGGVLQFKLTAAPVEELVPGKSGKLPQPAALLWKAVEWWKLDPQTKKLNWGSENSQTPLYLDTAIDMLLSTADADFFMPRGNKGRPEPVSGTPPALRCHAVARDYVQLTDGVRVKYEADRDALLKIIESSTALVMDENGRSVIDFIRQAVAEKAITLPALGEELTPADRDAAYLGLFAVIRDQWLNYELILRPQAGSGIPVVKFRKTAERSFTTISGTLWGWVAVERYRPVEVNQDKIAWLGQWVAQDDFLKEIDQKVVVFLIGDWAKSEVAQIGLQVELTDPTIEFSSGPKLRAIDLASVLDKDGHRIYELKLKGRSSLGLQLRWRILSLRLKDGSNLVLPGQKSAGADDPKWSQIHIAAYEDALYLWPQQAHELLASKRKTP